MATDLSRRFLNEILRAGGIDPDGPKREPMKPPRLPEDTKRAQRRASEIAHRDAMLRRAIQFTA